MSASIQSERDDFTLGVVIHSSLTAVDRQLLRFAVQTTVQARLGVSPEQIRVAARGSVRVVLARHTSLYLAQTVSGATLSQTGALFGVTRQVAAFAMRRIEDLRAAAAILKGQKIAVKRAMVVPGSGLVRAQAEATARLVVALEQEAAPLTPDPPSR
ncbi:MAG: hypothetical protein HC938_16775 [Nitrospira sp.]|nr:hypothetical protein [Nitrospira sp.]